MEVLRVELLEEEELLEELQVLALEEELRVRAQGVLEGVREQGSSEH